MSANVQAKELIVNEIIDRLDRAKSVVLIDYRGLTVAEVTELRNLYREAGVEYKVLKNTLIARAIEGKNLEDMNASLEGPTAVAFSYDDEVTAAKITHDFSKKVNKMEIKCGVMNGVYASKEEMETIASLPSREVLLAKMVGSIKAPLSNLVYAINAIKDQAEQA